MLNCRDVTGKIARDEVSKASWRTRLSVRVHLLLCRHCRQYLEQLRAMGSAGRELWGPQSQAPDSLERLERQILERCLGGLPGPDITGKEN